MDGDPVRVQRTGQFRRIEASLDIRDLGGSERDHLVVPVPAEERVEVMEVASRRAHDDGFDWHIFSLGDIFALSGGAECKPKLRSRSTLRLHRTENVRLRSGRIGLKINQAKRKKHLA